MFGFFYEIFWKPSVIFIWLRAKFGSQRGQKGLKSILLFFEPDSLLYVWVSHERHHLVVACFTLRSQLASRRLTSVQLWLWRWQGGFCVLTRSSCDNKCPLDYNSAMLITRSKYSYWLHKVKLPSYWSITGSKTICYICSKTCWTF